MIQVSKVISDIFHVSKTLFKVMIPTLIVVKLLQEAGLVTVLNNLMAPAMVILGLPSEMAIVLTTTMLTNPYAGLIVASEVDALNSLTVAQMSVLASFMLFTHSLPVEALISRQAGVRMRVVIALRVGCGFLFGFIISQFCAATGWFEAVAVPNLPTFVAQPGWQGWIVGQIKGLLFIQLVIIVLLFFLEFLKVIGVERLIGMVLTPFLKLMKVGPRASTIAIVGVTLGLGFGGGLLIKDVATGTIPKRDVFGVLCFINLLHSVFEDTAVVMLLGPSLVVILIIRALFAVSVIMLVMSGVLRLPDTLWQKMLINSHIPKEAG